MKKILFILFIIGSYKASLAQSVIAKIKYEQAEEAFNNNDFVTTLQKLDETQKLLGATNPKIMYLRIMAQKGILEKGNYDYELLDATRKSTAYFISNYEKNEGIEDKFKEVYLFAETLSKYPATKEEWDKLEVQKQEAIRKVEAEKRKLEDRADGFIDSVCKAWNWTPGLTKEQLKETNRKAYTFGPLGPGAWHVKKGTDSLFYSNDYASEKQASYVCGPNHTITYFVGVIQIYKATRADPYFEELKKLLLQYFPESKFIYNSYTDIGVKGYHRPTFVGFHKYYYGKYCQIQIIIKD